MQKKELDFINKKLEDLHFNSHWLLFCLFWFIVSRLSIYCLSYLNIEILNLQLPPLQWFFHWDSGWYLNIINKGYEPGPIENYLHYHNWAFFPLYPLTVKFLHHASGIDPVLLGQISSNLFFLIGACCFYYWLKQNFEEKLCRLGILLLMFSPYNIYFMSLYTESLFLMLSLVALSLAHKKHWLLANYVVALMSATRPNGVFMVFPLAYIFFNQWKKEEISIYQLATFLFSPLGIFAYMAYLKLHTGDALAFAHIQVAWGRTGWHTDNVIDLYNQLRNFQLNTYNFWIGVLSFSLACYTYFKKYKVESIYFFVMILPALLSGIPDSMARYCATLYCFYFALVLLCEKYFYKGYIILSIELVCLNLFILGWLLGVNPLT